MAASKNLVYLPTINDSTWLLMSRRGQSTCLRNYLVSPHEEDRRYSLDTVKTLLDNGGFSENLPAFNNISYQQEEFWREQINLRNAEYGLVPDNAWKLQQRFKEECRAPLDRRSVAGLRAVFERWTTYFDLVKEKRKQFNHWDNDPIAPKYIRPDTGMGWTAQLLNASRETGAVRYIRTGCDTTDFSLVAMELSLRIARGDNRFRHDYEERINPDGLALRENGYFTVVEVKGPQDESELVGPMLQATCAALALVPKRSMLKQIALKSGDRRPAFHRAEIPMQRRSIGVHVLTATDDQGNHREQWSSEVANACEAVIGAFPQLEYIAYSFVTPSEAKNLRSLWTDYLVTVDGVHSFPRLV